MNSTVSVYSSLSVAPSSHTSTSAPAVDTPRLGRSVSIEQATQLLGLSRRTIYNRIRDGRLRTIRTLGGSQRILVDSLEAMAARPLASLAQDVRFP